MGCSRRGSFRALPARDHHRVDRGVGTVPGTEKRLAPEGAQTCRNLPGSPCLQRWQPPLRRRRARFPIFAALGKARASRSSSPRGNDKFVAVISRNNTILLVDDDGYTVGTILAPNRMEWCYMHLSQATRLASCTELTKQP